jgi:hypothetical protein
MFIEKIKEMSKSILYFLTGPEPLTQPISTLPITRVAAVAHSPATPLTCGPNRQDFPTPIPIAGLLYRARDSRAASHAT